MNVVSSQACQIECQSACLLIDWDQQCSKKAWAVTLQPWAASTQMAFYLSRGSMAESNAFVLMV